MGVKHVERGVTSRSAWSQSTGAAAREDAIAVEEPLEIRLNGEPVATTMRTPGDDAHLAVGFLYSEGLLRGAEDVGSVVHCGRPGTEGQQNVIDLTVAPGVQVDLEKLQTSRRGTLRLPVRLNPGLSRGVVFVPFHWGDQHGEQTAANYLTISAIGRVAKQPEFKYCAVSLAPIPGATPVEPAVVRPAGREKSPRPGTLAPT